MPLAAPPGPLWTADAKEPHPSQIGHVCVSRPSVFSHLDKAKRSRWTPNASPALVAFRRNFLISANRRRRAITSVSAAASSSSNCTNSPTASTMLRVLTPPPFRVATTSRSFSSSSSLPCSPAGTSTSNPNSRALASAAPSSAIQPSDTSLRALNSRSFLARARSTLASL